MPCLSVRATETAFPVLAPLASLTVKFPIHLSSSLPHRQHSVPQFLLSAFLKYPAYPYSRGRLPVLTLKTVNQKSILLPRGFALHILAPKLPYSNILLSLLIWALILQLSYPLPALLF